MGINLHVSALICNIQINCEQHIDHLMLQMTNYKVDWLFMCIELICVDLFGIQYIYPNILTRGDFSCLY